jgi:hypothetical protein
MYTILSCEIAAQHIGDLHRLSLDPLSQDISVQMSVVEGSVT